MSTGLDGGQVTMDTEKSSQPQKHLYAKSGKPSLCRSLILRGAMSTICIMVKSKIALRLERK